MQPACHSIAVTPGCETSMSERIRPADVRDIFTYDDGVMLWRVRPGRNAAVGKSAGCSCPRKRIHAIVFKNLAYTRPRLVWAWHHGAWPERAIRHVNGDTFDDRIENLTDALEPSRLATNPLHGVVRYRTKSGDRYRVCTTAIFSDLEIAERALNAARIALRDAAVMPKDTGGL